MKRHVIAVKKALSDRRGTPDFRWGGISAQRNIAASVDEAYGWYVNDPTVTRIQVVDVDDDEVVHVLCDETFPDRIAGEARELERAARLDNRADATVHDVLWRECTAYPCKHATGPRWKPFPGEPS